jgi:hypothetical protein
VNGVVGFSGALLCIDGPGLSDGALLWVMAGAWVLALASFALVPPLASSGQAQAQAPAQAQAQQAVTLSGGGRLAKIAIALNTHEMRRPMATPLGGSEQQARERWRHGRLLIRRGAAHHHHRHHHIDRKVSPLHVGRGTQAIPGTAGPCKFDADRDMWRHVVQQRSGRECTPQGVL